MRKDFFGGYHVGWAAIVVMLALLVAWSGSYFDSTDNFYLALLAGLIPNLFMTVAYTYGMWVAAGFLQMTSIAVWSTAIVIFSHANRRRSIEILNLVLLVLSPIAFLSYYRNTSLWLSVNSPWVSVVFLSLAYYFSVRRKPIAAIGMILILFGIGGGPGVMFLQLIHYSHISIVVDVTATIGGIVAALGDKVAAERSSEQRIECKHEKEKKEPPSCNDQATSPFRN
jgi:hypothetical protein